MTARIDHITYNVTLCGKFYEQCEIIQVDKRNPWFLSGGFFTACPGACRDNCNYGTRVCVGGKDVCTELCDWRKDMEVSILIILIALVVLSPFCILYIISSSRRIDNKHNAESSLITYKPVPSRSASSNHEKRSASSKREKRPASSKREKRSASKSPDFSIIP